jgi:hypothetical protein
MISELLLASQGWLCAVEFRYVETTIPHENCIYEEGNSMLNSASSC